MTFSGSPIVNVWNGGTKNQLSEQRGADGGADADHDAADERRWRPWREEQQQVGRQRDVLARGRQHDGEERQPDDGERRRRASWRRTRDGATAPRPARRRGPAGGRTPARVPSRLGDDVDVEALGVARTMRFTTAPWTSSCQRLRRLAPITIWVAISERAKSTSAAGTSLADDLAVGAAELFEQAALVVEGRTGAGARGRRRRRRGRR